MKELRKYIDLYNTETILLLLQDKFNFVSTTDGGNTIPKLGSYCNSSKNINTKAGFKIVDLICHRNGNITIKTNSNKFIQFLN